MQFFFFNICLPFRNCEAERLTQCWTFEIFFGQLFHLTDKGTKAHRGPHWAHSRSQGKPESSKGGPWKGVMWPLRLQPWSSLGQSPSQRSTVALDNYLSPTLYLTAEQSVLAGRAQDWVTPSEKIAGPLIRNA